VYDRVGGTELIPHLSALLAKPHFDPSIPTSGPGAYFSIVVDNSPRAVIPGATSYLTTPSMVLRVLLGSIGLGPRYNCINHSSGEEELGALLTWSAEGRLNAAIDGKHGRENRLGRLMVGWKAAKLRGRWW
jgi:hypothetical protein